MNWQLTPVTASMPALQTPSEPLDEPANPANSQPVSRLATGGTAIAPPPSEKVERGTTR